MQTSTSTTDDRTGGKGIQGHDAKLVSVQTVATFLSCSTRHVYRMADAGRMPRPLKLGALIRWNRVELEKWLEDGCPNCRQGGSE